MASVAQILQLCFMILAYSTPVYNLGFGF